MHDASPGNIRTDEAGGLLALAEKYTVDFMLNAHSCEGEPILQTPAMSLPAGHYRVQLEYRYRPGMDADGVEHHASVYFTAGEEMAVSGEHGWVDGNAQQDTVVLNVDYASDTVRLVANKGKFGAFAYYCWAAGAVTLVLTALQ